MPYKTRMFGLLVGLAAGYMFLLVVRAPLKYPRAGEVRREKAEAKKTRGEALKAHRMRCKMTQNRAALRRVRRRAAARGRRRINIRNVPAACGSAA